MALANVCTIRCQIVQSSMISTLLTFNSLANGISFMLSSFLTNPKAYLICDSHVQRLCRGEFVSCSTTVTSSPILVRPGDCRLSLLQTTLRALSSTLLTCGFRLR
ncbi:hypothetical protein SCHPADRAFT_721287 [Schizopora paradoxa]|uniref:Uncharacterized protein n=1 Tax=Schizopora paradoxa TaxID=27342 RepID=A0A0H2R2I1_9AGAM|nr:hypothetical protein SCHPADRAFT_721287 [Schizopora paradoxa]